MNTTLEYNGHTVTLTDKWEFHIAGPTIEPDDTIIFDSLAESKARIDDRVKRAARQQQHWRHSDERCSTR